MIFEDRITIDAPCARVWDFLLDPVSIAACMPGVEDVTQIDDRTFDAVIAANVGPISGKFTFRAHIVESNPPTEMVAEVDGTDSVTRSALSARMVMTLDPVDDATTELGYRVSVDVKGRLAILGEMVLRATTSLIVEEATRRLRVQLATTESGV